MAPHGPSQIPKALGPLFPTVPPWSSVRDPAVWQRLYVMERVDGFIPALAPTELFSTRSPPALCANVLDKLVDSTGSTSEPPA